jgi:hypothetical protein
MTWFRDKPICRLKEDAVFTLDTKFLTDKLDSGIFWRVHNHFHSGKGKEQLHNYWGTAFENYLNWLLGQACRNSRNKFYPTPHYKKTGEEVCDAIVICATAAVFLEYRRTRISTMHSTRCLRVLDKSCSQIRSLPTSLEL